MKVRTRRWLIAFLLMYLIVWLLTFIWGIPQLNKDINEHRTDMLARITTQTPFPLILGAQTLKTTPNEYYYGHAYYFWFFGYRKYLGSPSVLNDPLGWTWKLKL